MSLAFKVNPHFFEILFIHSIFCYYCLVAQLVKSILALYSIYLTIHQASNLNSNLMIRTNLFKLTNWQKIYYWVFHCQLNFQCFTLGLCHYKYFLKLTNSYMDFPFIITAKLKLMKTVISLKAFCPVFWKNVAFNYWFDCFYLIK